MSPWHRGEDKLAAQYTLHYVLERLVKVLAPVTPFIADKIWEDMYGERSVHFEAWPEPDEKAIDGKLEKNMAKAKDIFEAATSARQDSGVKLRWPIKDMTVAGDTEAIVAAKSMKGILCSLINVSDIKTKRAKKMSIKLGKVLKDEAFLRELIRKTQALRKQEGLMVHDQISLVLETDSETGKLLERRKDDMLKGTGAKSVALEAVKDVKGDMVFEGREVKIGFRKA